MRELRQLHGAVERFRSEQRGRSDDADLRRIKIGKSSGKPNFLRDTLGLDEVPSEVGDLILLTYEVGQSAEPEYQFERRVSGGPAALISAPRVLEFKDNVHRTEEVEVFVAGKQYPSSGAFEFVVYAVNQETGLQFLLSSITDYGSPINFLNGELGDGRSWNLVEYRRKLELRYNSRIVAPPGWFLKWHLYQSAATAGEQADYIVQYLSRIT